MSLDWTNLPVHPDAALFPMMSDDQIKMLADDIRDNGLVETVVIFCDNTAGPDKRDQYTYSLLDGRARVAALKLLGVTDLDSGIIKRVKIDRTYTFVNAVTWGSRFGSDKIVAKPGTDPEGFVMSTNGLRRHLKGKQKRDLVAKLLDRHPEWSDREICRKLGWDADTQRGIVGAVREEVIGVVESTTPITPTAVERVAEAAKADPNLSIRQLAEREGVGYGTAQVAKQRAVEPEEVIGVVESTTPITPPRLTPGAQPLAGQTPGSPTMTMPNPFGTREQAVPDPNRQAQLAIEKAKREWFLDIAVKARRMNCTAELIEYLQRED